MKPLTLVIDADYFAYRAASAAEEELEFTSDLTFVVSSHKNARRLFKQRIAEFRERFDTNEFVLCWTDTKNFRKEIDPNYKGNRTKRKPCGYAKLKNWAMQAYPCLIKEGLEADDAMGILCTNGTLENFILISPDKDMLQIPVRIYNTKDEFDVSPAEGLQRVFIQALTGDATDGYKGCEGIGPKRASEILQGLKTPVEMWEAVVAAYKDKGFTLDDAIRNLRLARILQSSDWDTENQSIIPYSPWNLQPQS